MERGHIEIVNLIMAYDATDCNWGLVGAYRSGQTKLVNLMMSKGATEENRGSSIGGMASKLVNLIIAKGATNINAALCGACRCENIEIIDLMIDKGANELDRVYMEHVKVETWQLSSYYFLERQTPSGTPGRRTSLGGRRYPPWASGAPKGVWRCCADNWNIVLVGTSQGNNIEIVKLKLTTGVRVSKWALQVARINGYGEILSSRISCGVLEVIFD